ncbi:MAG TPA: hypothetical protein DHD79_01855 [Firmicutes bacterium]|nr:hypothetical protein [Bacillota bacterium]HBL68605.1 hypothetical protein [Bacillota bacterium]HBR23051.1 hypothetical protein [Bacillota bacterium]HCF89503.1 hypothetical protein [Bacillota bacterium]HCF91322.1 hypothetical protein [Bacillota bacterium]
MPWYIKTMDSTEEPSPCAVQKQHRRTVPLCPCVSVYPRCRKENIKQVPGLWGGIVVNVVYYCWDGIFDSPMAAMIHLGYLSEERPPKIGELLALPNYGRVDRAAGRLYLAGVDGYKNAVFTLGCLNKAELIQRVILEATRQLFKSEAQFLFFDCQSIPAWRCFLAKKLAMADPSGLRLNCRESIKSFAKIAAVVKNAKENLGY